MQTPVWKKVLVTGGSGFIGQQLVPRLQAAGMRVLVLSRDPERTRRQLPETTVSDRVVELAKERPEAVVNLAGAGIADWPWTARRRRVLLDSRVALTRTLHQAFQDAPPAVLVSGSAVGFYGTHPEQRFTESDGPGQGFAADLCVRWEDAAERFSTLGTRVVRLRTGLVMGPGGLLARMRLPFSLGLGGRLGTGEQWMSWVHREDVVAMIEWALGDHSLAGAINATAPNPVTNAEFTRTLAGVLSRPAPIPVPGWVLRAGLGQMAEELLLNGARVEPAVAQDRGHAFSYPELEPALRQALARPQ